MAPSVGSSAVEMIGIFLPAILGGLFMALLCGFIGCFLVMRKASLLSDTLAHSSLAGVGLGFALGVPPGFTVFPTAIVLGFAMAWMHLNRKENLASMTAVLFSFCVGIGILLMTRFGAGGAEVVHVLFGDLVWIGQQDLVILIFLGVPLGLYFYLKRREFILSAINRDLARMTLPNADRTEYAAILGFSLTIALCLKLVGVMLVTALLTIPALIAARLAKSMRHQLLLSPVIAGICTLIGISLSLAFDLPTGACVAVVCGIIFTVTSFGVRSE